MDAFNQMSTTQKSVTVVIVLLSIIIIYNIISKQKDEGFADMDLTGVKMEAPIVESTVPTDVVGGLSNTQTTGGTTYDSQIQDMQVKLTNGNTIYEDILTKNNKKILENQMLSIDEQGLTHPGLMTEQQQKTRDAIMNYAKDFPTGIVPETLTEWLAQPQSTRTMVVGNVGFM